MPGWGVLFRNSDPLEPVQQGCLGKVLSSCTFCSRSGSDVEGCDVRMGRPALFSSQTSVTAIADTQSRSRNNSPTVQHRELRPSPETDPKSAAKPFSAAL